MPKEEEERVAREYCLHHDLVRPATDAKRAVGWWLAVEVAACLLSFGIDWILRQWGISVSFLLVHSLSGVVIVLVFLKRICILSVELYQHYASEEMRRRCMLMPTCSEYALLAFRKYGAVRGGCKTFVRLMKRCGGKVYRIDYP